MQQVKGILVQTYKTLCVKITLGHAVKFIKVVSFI